jgi:hypothetical protein
VVTSASDRPDGLIGPNKPNCSGLTSWDDDKPPSRRPHQPGFIAWPLHLICPLINSIAGVGIYADRQRNIGSDHCLRIWRSQPVAECRPVTVLDGVSFAALELVQVSHATDQENRVTKFICWTEDVVYAEIHQFFPMGKHGDLQPRLSILPRFRTQSRSIVFYIRPANFELRVQTDAHRRRFAEIFDPESGADTYILRINEHGLRERYISDTYPCSQASFKLMSGGVGRLFGNQQGGHQDKDTETTDARTPSSNTIKFFSSNGLPFYKSYLLLLLGPVFGVPSIRVDNRLSSRGIRNGDRASERRGWWLMFFGFVGVNACFLFFGGFFLAQWI